MDRVLACGRTIHWLMASYISRANAALIDLRELLAQG